MSAIIGNQVSSDLELSTIHKNIPIQTKWGQDLFYKQLMDCSTSPNAIKKKQLPLLVLHTESTIRKNIQSHIHSLQSNIEFIDDCFDKTDQRIQELISQILWKPAGIGAFLNTSPFILNTFISWKTLVLPGFAIFMPILMFIIPFFLQRIIEPNIEVSDYLEQVKAVVLKQITVPTILKSRSPTDRIGFFLESLFIGLTLAMFISSLWNQITSSLHLRTIWFDLDMRGSTIQNLRNSVKYITEELRKIPIHKQRGIRSLIEEGEQAIEQTKKMDDLDNVSTFGLIWNNPTEIIPLKTWIGKLDVLSSIASLQNICYPTMKKTLGINIKNVIHPSLTSCVKNSIDISNHIIITGPNRGGKSTFCKTLGISIMTAQSWGFAWAESMSFRPFHSIVTVLEPCGKLGIESTFEAEIEFAKSVLASTKQPIFVMMDEIFHSTNAIDGFSASQVFLKRLYKKLDVVSVISTHYIQLADSFQETAKAYQLITHEREDTTLEYTYQIAPGVSNKSSVMEILRERGLLEA